MKYISQVCFNFFVLFSALSQAQQTKPGADVDAILQKYTANYPSVKLSQVKYNGKDEYSDNVECTKEVSAIRQHKFAVFGGATGFGVGYYLNAKKIINKAMLAEMETISNQNDEIDKLINKIGDQNEIAADTSSKLKRFEVDSKAFRDGYRQLKIWMNTLDRTTPEGVELGKNIQQMDTLMTSVENGSKKLPILLEKYKNLKSSAASAQEIETARSALEQQSAANIKTMSSAKTLFSEKISGKIIGTSYRSYLNDKAILESSKLDAAESAEKMASKVRGALARSAGDVLNKAAVVAGPIGDYHAITSMVDDDQAFYSQTSEILNEHNDPKFICSTTAGLSKERRDEFRTNLSRLKTAAAIDDGKLVKNGASGQSSDPSPGQR